MPHDEQHECTPLEAAVRGDHVNVVKYLIAQGADTTQSSSVSDMTFYGTLALYTIIAPLTCHTYQLEWEKLFDVAIENSTPEIAQLLLKHGANELEKGVVSAIAYIHA